MHRTLSSLSRLNQAARNGSMRRRSRLEANLANGRSPTRRYLLYCAMFVFSLLIPAALTLRGNQPLPSEPPPSAGVERNGGGGGGGGATLGGRDGVNAPATSPAQPRWEGRDVQDLGAVSPLVWRGIGDGIASTPASADDIHVVFSTDCSPYQNYQAILLFHSAEVVGQKGRVTRVASGCTEEEKAELQVLMLKQPERFGVHFTPDYSLDPDTKERFMFYNKPNGMAHFLKNADPPVMEAVVALIDPDMILMSPLTPNVGDADTMLWHEQDQATGPTWVEEGAPVGQFYGLGGSWTKWKDLPEITKGLGRQSPARAVSQAEALASYPVGPPYLMHPRDWARVLDLWVALSPKVYKGHAGILAEMYGFCIAVAHLGLRHRVAYGLMVSDSSMSDKEGWPLVDVLGMDSCSPSSVDHRRSSLPPVVHYCQMYRVGTFMWGKRHKSHHIFFSCNSDSLQLPPEDYLQSPMGTVRVHPIRMKATTPGPDYMTPAKAVRQGYALCAVLRAMNEALEAYKARYCHPEEITGGVRRFTDLSEEQLAEDGFS